MSTEPRPIDITDSVELLELVEEVRRSGVELLLKRGEQDLALLVPVTPHQEVQARAGEDRDALLNIIAIGESAEPTDIARDEQEYLAEAYAPARR